MNKKNIKDYILKGLVVIAILNFIFTATIIDSLSTDGYILALIVNAIGFLYLFLFGYANKRFN